MICPATYYESDTVDDRDVDVYPTIAMTHLFHIHF
jgi:hypothetical protein